MMLGRACRYLPLDPSKVRTGTAVQRLRHTDTRMRERTDLFWKHIQVYLFVSQVFAPVEGSTPEERWDKCIEQVCVCVCACVLCVRARVNQCLFFFACVNQCLLFFTLLFSIQTRTRSIKINKKCRGAMTTAKKFTVSYTLIAIITSHIASTVSRSACVYVRSGVVCMGVVACLRRVT